MQYTISVHRVVKQKKAAREYIETHTHPYFHYIYVIGGMGIVEVDGHRIDATKHMIFLVPPKIEHAIYGVDEFSSIDLKFSCDPATEEKLAQMGYCAKDMSAYEDSLIKDVFNEAVLARNEFEDIINVRILELLFRLMRRKKDDIYMCSDEKMANEFYAVPSVVKTGRMQLVLNYIDNHITLPLRVADLAVFCGYSESYFSSYFKKCLGCSPNQYINTKKIELAKEMILSGSLNITQIAEKLGYESIHYFSRIFKKTLGMSPMMYYNRVNSNVGINVIKNSEYCTDSEFLLPLKKLADYSV